METDCFQKIWDVIFYFILHVMSDKAAFVKYSRVHPGRWGGATHLGGATRVAPSTPNSIGL